jgi:hypothetical protein
MNTVGLLTKLVHKISEVGDWRREQIILFPKCLIVGKSSQILIYFILVVVNVLSSHRGSYSYQIFYVPAVSMQGYENIRIEK